MSNFLNLEFDISGEVSSSYYLESKNYVPERELKKIYRVTSIMMESGCNQHGADRFKLSMSWHLGKHFPDNDVNNDAIEPTKLLQLNRAFLFCLCLYGLATMIFFAGRLIFKWRKQRQPKFRTSELCFHIQIFQ